MQRHTAFTLGLAAAAALTQAAPAQDRGANVPLPDEPTAAASPAATASEEAARAEAAALSFHVSPRGTLTFRADLDDSPGSVSVARAGLNAGVSGNASQRLRLSLDVDAEFSWYDFNNATGLAPGTDDPFNDVYRVGLAPRVLIAQSERLAVVIGGLVQSAGEYDADFGDTLTFGGFGGVRFQATENLALTLGAAARSRLEEDALVLPLIGIEWGARGGVRIASEGLGLRITAPIADTLDFTLAGGWELREYRLADDNAIPEGVARDNRVPIAAGLTWRPTQSASISLVGGAVVWQEFRLDDSSGNRVSEVNTNPAPFIGLSGRIGF